jgi:cytochrome c-type biogenesis protein CcmE
MSSVDDGAVDPSEQTVDAGDALDLRPRRVRTRPKRSRTLLTGGLVLAIFAVIGVITFRLLSDASLFFLNVDEAIEQREDLAGERFRIQGTPGAETTELEVEFEQAVAFSIHFDGVVADAVHVGSPPDLFQPGVPVVLEGRWVQGVPDGIDAFDGGVNDGWYFLSSRMLVKHDNEYRTDNAERLAEADEGGAVPLQP